MIDKTKISHHIVHYTDDTVSGCSMLLQNELRDVPVVAKMPPLLDLGMRQAHTTNMIYFILYPKPETSKTHLQYPLAMDCYVRLCQLCPDDLIPSKRNINLPICEGNSVHVSFFFLSSQHSLTIPDPCLDQGDQGI